MMKTAGLVSLVGAGPGDPDLLTVRAVRVLREAECVLYDRLVPAAILALARPGARREFAGKCPQHSAPTTQQAINTRLIALARRYRRVVRLKGGDPFVFGRGGEEALALQAADIPWEVVPGITAAVGCGAAAGIPLTHRGLARQVSFVTAHGASGTEEIDWPALAGPSHTLVFYMGVAEVARIEHGLLAHGRPPDTPAAFIERGCTPRQRVVRGTLAGLAARALEVRLEAPALVIVGEVAALELTPLASLATACASAA